MSISKRTIIGLMGAIVTALALIYFIVYKPEKVFDESDFTSKTEGLPEITLTDAARRIKDCKAVSVSGFRDGTTLDIDNKTRLKITSDNGGKLTESDNNAIREALDFTKTRCTTPIPMSVE